MYLILTCLLILCTASTSYSFVSISNDDTLNSKQIETEVARVSYRFKITASASYINYHNWQSYNRSAFSFLNNVDFRHRKSFPSGWSHDHFAKVELGFLYYNDSIWWKNADQIRVGLQWTEKPGKFLSHSYAVFVQTQLLKSWQFKYNGKTDQQEKELKGWFMAPGLLELAYGLNWNFWERSRINVAFATCRISSKPRYNDERSEKYESDESLFKSKRRFVKTEYGFSAQLFIYKDIYPKVLLWEHQSRFFFNALNRNGLHANISNQFTLRFLKYMQFRIDTQVLYEPDLSTKWSYRQELLIGMVYEFRR